MKVTVGQEIPLWTMEKVCPARMRTVAAILRDPNPVHWDRSFVAERGGGERGGNQSPLNVGYVANMLMAWAGQESIRHLRVRFNSNVLEGDRVEASGTVTEIHRIDGVLIAECDVRLTRQTGELALEGVASVIVPG